MSFRIEDILSNRNFFPNKQNVESVKREEFFLPHRSNFEANTVLENDREKLANVSKIPIHCTGYQAHCLTCLATKSKEMTRNHFASGFCAYQGPKACCSLVAPVHDKIYTSPCIYPEKIYSQTTTYSHLLPINFPMYQQYSKRRNQVRFSTSQTKALEHKFIWQKYLSPEDRKSLAHSLKLSDRQVKTWFQNRRAKWRRNANSPTNCDVKPEITHPVT